MTNDERMEGLTSLLRETFPHRAYVLTWVGPTPSEMEPTLAFLAEMIGYPPSGWEGSPSGFVQRTRHEAAVTTAMLATQSQAYGFHSPPPADLTAQIEAGFAQFLPDGWFVSNADHLVAWETHSPPWRSDDPDHEFEISASRCVTTGVKLSKATFDTGIVGSDGQVGFIAWAEEED